ncbi:Luminal-binding protein 1 [Hordeum vulgare]|nr:Luminal-binding protein 1 [Hordeum vulgare]
MAVWHHVIMSMEEKEAISMAKNKRSTRPVRRRNNTGLSSLIKADQFNKQLANGDDIRQSPKAMAKLKKQVKRTKEILSANTAAPILVESLYNDIDFRSTITHEKFEELCEDLWEQALTPIKDVLAQSGMKISDIYDVELIGGATRVPKLQAKLQESLGRSELDKHLDADEAIVLGASLHAANLSNGIKLNHKLGMIDGSPYGFVFEIDGPDYVKDESTDQLFRSIKDTKDFDVSLSYDKASELSPGVLSHKFAEYAISGLTETSEKYGSRNLSAPIKANLHFSLSRRGIIFLDRAEAVIEITEWVEVPKKNVALETNTTDQTLSAESGTSDSTMDSGWVLNGMEDLSSSSRVTSLLWNHASPNIFDPATVTAMEGFYQEIHVFFDGVNTLPGLAPPWLGEDPRAGLLAGCASTNYYGRFFYRGCPTADDNDAESKQDTVASPEMILHVRDLLQSIRLREFDQRSKFPVLNLEGLLSKAGKNLLKKGVFTP